MLDRRRFLESCGGACVLGAFPAAVRAQFRIEASGIGTTQLPIAVTRFRDEERAPHAVSTIIRADLERSGRFRAVDTGTAALDEVARPDMSDWRSRSADALVGGSATRLADGRFDVRYMLWDVVKGSELGGQAIAVGQPALRLAAHRAADQIYEKLTGEKGVFATRIAYVSKIAGIHTLWIADSDGEGREPLLKNSEPIISPAWSPDGRELAYVSFERRKATVWVQEIATSKRRLVANFKGSNSAPAWSPDGQQLAVTLSRDGGSQLFVMDRNGGNVRRLTQSSGIDTEAAWSPDGRLLYFVSDRGGSPQIYRTPASGGGAERVTFSGSYNVSPAISPDGRHLAYVSRNGGAFRLALTPLGGGGTTVLTETTDDESPSFAPNGKLLIYSTREGGRDVLKTTTLDGRIKATLAVPQADVREPVWGPYGR
jgi:TolB protein